MGCCGSKSTYGVDVDIIPEKIQKARSKYGTNILLMCIKDQNVPGKLCLSGGTSDALEDELTTLLKADKNNTGVVKEKDKYDHMYDTVWRHTSLTTGHATFSLTKSYFPRGTLLVKMFDLLARHGWLLYAAPNFGGVESRDDKGNITSCVDWPVFVFYKDSADSQYTHEHLFFGVKDSNIPGKLCAAGPVGDMEAAMATKLQAFTPDVKSEKDSYDEDFDVVWRNTSITSGHCLTSFEKSYFPKGQTNVAVLECAYSFGWRALAAPNFGGQGDSWPCVIFRKLKEGSNPPKVVLVSIKDANIPGKVCFAGSAASALVPRVCSALQQVPGNNDVKAEKDQYDSTYDEVLRNTKMTSGAFSSLFGLEYFPRCDSMTTFLDTMTAQRFSCVACPNFGGMLDSWPTFIFEETPNPQPTMWVAVKDDNIPGKLNLGGGDIKSDPTLAQELSEVLADFCGPKVEQTKDSYDESYDFCFKNTVLTSGHATFTFAKPYWPHGFVIEAFLAVLLKHGWVAVGGPNFGQNGNTWPGFVFTKSRKPTE
jgi:hypothetical protein